MWEEDGCSQELPSVFQKSADPVTEWSGMENRSISIEAEDWCKDNFLHFRALRQAIVAGWQPLESQSTWPWKMRDGEGFHWNSY